MRDAVNQLLEALKGFETTAKADHDTSNLNNAAALFDTLAEVARSRARYIEAVGACNQHTAYQAGQCVGRAEEMVAHLVSHLTNED